MSGAVYVVAPGVAVLILTRLLLVFADKLGFLGQISSSVRLAVGGLVFKEGMFWIL